MTKELEKKIDHCAVLLAHSLLAEDIKMGIIRNIEEATEEDLDRLIKVLEKEQAELTKLGVELKKLDEQQDADWTRLAEEQQKFANKEVEEFVKQTEQELLELMKKKIKE